METVITTIGTSLLTNRDARPWAGRVANGPLPDAADVETWLASAPPERASAEIHTWLRLGLLNAPENRRAVTLVHSHTVDGTYCAERLAGYARGHGIEADLRRVDGLRYERGDEASFSRGLGQLVRTLAETIRAGWARAAGRRDAVALAATGGFKAEIAVANLVGAVMGVRVCYIYEQFEHLVWIDPLPVILNPDWFGDGRRELLRRVHESDILPRREIENLLRGDPQLGTLLSTESIDGIEHVGLNALGEIARELLLQPRAAWPPPCDTPPEQKDKIDRSSGHHRPRGWEQAIDWLARNRRVRLIHYDGTAGTASGVRPAGDSAADVLVCLADGKAPPFGLRVTTTAETPEQRELVLREIRSSLKL